KSEYQQASIVILRNIFKAYELIEEEKPLSTTEDRVKFDSISQVVVVDEYFVKSYWRLFFLLQQNFKNIKVFAHELNADEYILWNKPLLSLQEIDAKIKGHLPEFDELKKLAEERVEE